MNDEDGQKKIGCRFAILDFRVLSKVHIKQKPLDQI